MSHRHLTETTWQETREAAPGAIALLPIGSQEQHAGHLPMGTDTLLVDAVVDRALALLDEDATGGAPSLVRLPTLPYGHSPHHLFAAALTLSAPTLGAVLGEILDSLAACGHRRILVVNGHGGNDEIMKLAVKRFALRAEVTAAACSYWTVTGGGEDGGRPDVTPGHAGWFETSSCSPRTPPWCARPSPRGPRSTRLRSSTARPTRGSPSSGTANGNASEAPPTTPPAPTPRTAAGSWTTAPSVWRAPSRPSTPRPAPGRDRAGPHPPHHPNRTRNSMKITDVDVHVVNLPLVNPFTSSFETKTGETRTVVRIRTDTGVEGWGETMWGRPVAAIVKILAEDLIGMSPFALEAFHRKQHMVPFFYGYLGYAAIAALDVACWDAMGKATGQSVTDLLGGPVREEVPLTALVTRADAPGAGPPTCPPRSPSTPSASSPREASGPSSSRAPRTSRGTSRSSARCAPRCPR